MTASFRVRLVPISLLILVLVLAIAVPAMLAAVDAGVSAHAAVRHGSDASVAQACKGSGIQVHSFYNSATHRTGLVCEVDGKWAVVIMDEWGREVTSFVKNKMHNFEQVLKYMRNAGYELIQ